MPLRVQHINRIVFDAFDHLAQSLLAAPQCLLCLLALGDIARYLGKPSQFSSAVANGIEHDVRPKSFSALRQPPSFLFEMTLGRRDAKVLRGQAALDIFSGVK